MNVNRLGAKNLIDSTSAAKLSEELFGALSKKSVDYSKVNLSKFNRPAVGVDFYNEKTDINLQRQIAMANSGVFQTINLKSVQSLNALAAQALYSDAVANKVGGKMTIDNTYNEFEFISEVGNAENLINVFETNKDKKDSNPFTYEGFKQNTQNKEI